MKLDLKNMSLIELRELSSSLLSDISNIQNQLEMNAINDTRGAEWVARANSSLRAKKSLRYAVETELGVRKASKFSDKLSKFQSKEKHARAFVKIAKLLLEPALFNQIDTKAKQQLEECHA